MYLKNIRKGFIVKLATISMIVTSIIFMNTGTAFALVPTSMKDTLTREKVSVAASHVVSMTLPAGGIPAAATMTVTYPGTFGTLTTTPDVICGTGTASAGLGTTVLTITGTGSGCTGTLLVGSVTPFTSTNPGSAGSYLVTLGGTSITGSFAVTIVTDDQVGVTASVNPAITFDVGAQASGTGCDGTFSADGGTVALGTLSTSTVTSSDASSIMHICSRLTTNAGSGAVVTVKSLNGNLTSTAGTIPSNTATPLAINTAGYGLCVGSAGADTGFDVTVPIGVLPTRVSPFNNASCTAAAHNIGGVTTSAQGIWSVSAASQSAFARIYVKAGISGTVPASASYSDTLTFVATGTF